MSETVIQEIESVLADAIPFSGTINTGVDLADKVVSVITPPIAQAEADKPTNEQKERLQAYETIINNPNEGARARQLNDYIEQLCSNALLPVGLLSNRTITVPLEYFTALVNGVGQLIEQREQAAALAVKTK